MRFAITLAQDNAMPDDLQFNDDEGTGSPPLE
jgi:hypothetical protein